MKIIDKRRNKVRQKLKDKLGKPGVTDRASNDILTIIFDSMNKIFRRLILFYVAMQLLITSPVKVFAE